MSELSIAFTQNHTYKSTDAGLIPTDWECVRLGDICSFVGGAQPDKNVFIYKEKKGFIRLIQIRDYKSDKDIVYIPENLARKKCDAQDIMIGRYGPPIFQILRGIEGAYNVALIKVIPIKTVDREFIFHFIRNEKLFSLMDTLSQRSSGQTGVDLPALRDYPVGLPPLEEQASIAQALNDVDTLLHGLEKLIAKKLAIKTASMQQLLTGKKRLLEFASHKNGEKKGQPKGMKLSELGDIPEDWEAISFGELFLGTVQRKKLKQSELTTFVGMQDVSENAQLTHQHIVQFNSVKSGFTYFEKRDVLVAKITPCFENGKGCSTHNLQTDVGFGSTEFHVLRATKDADNMFIYFWTIYDALRRELESEMVGSAGHRRVPFSALQNYKIPAPKQKEEQAAIANILLDMDNEIQSLEKRLQKTRQIKKGMMQELLSGRTRLPLNKS